MASNIAPLPISSPGDIVLGTHAVIEASAGTGKTYTIENLVVRMLCEPVNGRLMKIDEILLVTFTEKAAGELRERIRNKIEEIIPDANESSGQALRHAVENFDMAKVFTIHGFCQNILRQYAFENGEGFEQQVVDDAPLYLKCLHDLMRRWSKQYGTSLAEILQLSGYPAQSQNSSSWESLVVSVAQRYSPEAADLLLPEVVQSLEEIFVSAEQILKTSLGQLAKLNSSPADLESSFLCQYQDAGQHLNASSYATRQKKILLPLIQLLCSYQNGESLLSAFACFMAECQSCSKFDELGFSVLLHKPKKSAPEDMVAAFPLLAQLIDSLDRLRLEVNLEQIQKYLQAETVLHLKEAVRIYKREQSQISFDDMLTLVHAALYEDGSTLLPALQNSYSVALVDEFQDTDRVQWEIFKRIFLDSGTGSRSLIVVGDPKQAIYSFRGADVYTYLDARENMLSQFKANYYSLQTNWRSSAALVSIFNPMFMNGNWFGKGEISCPASLPSPKSKDATVIDKLGREPLVLLPLVGEGQKGTASEMKKKMANFIASEIRSLLYGDSGKATFHFEGRPCSASDICVLVRSRQEAVFVEQALDAVAVPHTFYKKPGLYQSEEALHLHYMLLALARSDDRQALMKGLLSHFFSFTLEELDKFDEFVTDSPAFQLMAHWQELAFKRQWSRFFRSLLEESGLLVREAGRVRGERRITNYQHICQNLLLEAKSKKLDLFGVVNLLAAYRNGSLNVEKESELHREETDLPRVQLMTIHASKGLEFPVLFLAGGYSAPKVGRYCFYNQKLESDDPAQARRRNVYDLIAKKEAKQLHTAYLEEEEKRLFYVALTRAKYKLYLPFISPLSKSRNSPLLRLVSSAVDSLWGQDKQSQGVTWVSEDVAPVGLPGEGDYDGSILEKVHVQEPLFPEHSFSFWGRRRDITSFSSLKEYASPVEATYGDEPQNIEQADDLGEEQPYMNDFVVDSVLPRGAATGSMLHEIFENIDFVSVGKKNDFMSLVDDESFTVLAQQKIARYRIKPLLVAVSDPAQGEALLLQEVARIIWTTITAKLGPVGFSLAEVDAQKRLHELEFYYPLPLLADPRLPDIKVSSDGFMTGFIDLIFEHAGRYYILDWKSNFLTDYSASSLQNAMLTSRYDRQYEIYTIAVVRWLSQKIPGFSVETHFGGVYYLFVRGIDETGEHGVFYHNPETSSTVGTYERKLALLLGDSNYREDSSHGS